MRILSDAPLSKKKDINNMKTVKTKKKKSAKLANPVTSLANKIASVFANDYDVDTKFYFNKSTLRIICEEKEVAYALAAISKSHFDLGNLFLDVQFLYYDNKGKKQQVKDATRITDPAEFAAAFELAFKGNEAFGDVVSSKDIFGSTWYYLLGNKIVLQYDNDDTRNPWGVSSCLPEEVFADLFEIPNGIKVSTI